MVKAHSKHISYQETGKFSSLIHAYLNRDSSLTDFFSHYPDLDGIKKAIEDRKKFPTNRKLIKEVFEEAYGEISATDLQQKNIVSLLGENTFTVCTAHQPNIFTGYLYFIYKTAHTIVLAKKLNNEFPDAHFVPVFYIGSEDNDFDELSRFKINGKLFRWNTQQQGAVGRMKVDKNLINLIEQIEAELAHLPFAKDLIASLRSAYSLGVDVAEATFILLNELFGNEGLLVLQPDLSSLKNSMKSIFKDDLLHCTPFGIVDKTNEKLAEKFSLQVNARPINLFYLRDQIRNRIDKRGNVYSVDGTNIRFTEKEILEELSEHPERFSPNVILRGLYQETILPNIAFIGGGSEVAYWMQLKALFNHYHVPYPVLILRNSFIIMNSKQQHKLDELGISISDLFKDETVLANEMVVKWTDKPLSLNNEVSQSKELFAHLKKLAGSVDKSLVQHVHALETDMLKKIDSLEKKMLRAERKKQTVQLQRIWKLKSELFPSNNLQERVDNFMPYYAAYGKSLIECVLNQSLSIEQQFILMIVDER
jgi:bacillithiol biosynthesis cysteine-adding enzyme BshC